MERSRPNGPAALARAPSASTGRHRSPPRGRPCRRRRRGSPACVLGEPLGTPHEARRRRGTRRGWPGTRRRSGPSRGRSPAATPLRRPPAARPGRRMPDAAASALTSGGYFVLWHIGRWTSLPSTPLPGGWSGQTFLADVGGGAQRGPDLRRPPATGATRRTRWTPRCSGWCAGWSRCPRCSRSGAPTRPPGRPRCWSRRTSRACAATSCCRPSMPTGWPLVGHRLGQLLATLGGMPMLRPGPFVDGELRIGDFGGRTGCASTSRRRSCPASRRPSSTASRSVAAEAQHRLDGVDRCCLVHSDFNPKNLMFDPDTLERPGPARLGVRARRRARTPTSATCCASTGTRRTSTPSSRRTSTAAAATRPRCWSRRAPPTCGRWSSWRAGSVRTPSPTGPTPCCGRSPAAGDVSAAAD